MATLALLLGISRLFCIRMEEAAAFETRIREALRTYERLADLPLFPTVRVPFWRVSPPTVRPSGPADPALRQLARCVIEREVDRIGPYVRFEHHPDIFGRFELSRKTPTVAPAPSQSAQVPPPPPRMPDQLPAMR
jgi:hypothetical protein